jgi:plastocyanin
MKNTIIVIMVLLVIGLAYYFISKPAVVTAPVNTAPVTTETQPQSATSHAAPSTTSSMPAMNMPAATTTSESAPAPSSTASQIPASHTVSVVSNSSVTSSKASVIIKNFAFTPASMTVKAGTVVTWTNDDNASHTVTSDSGTTLNSPAINVGGTFSFTFTTPGTYAYHCSIHPSMHGTIVVTS